MNAYLAPALAGIMLVLTLTVAAIGAVDAEEPFPEEVQVGRTQKLDLDKLMMVNVNTPL
jgi:hypothetical protein